MREEEEGEGGSGPLHDVVGFVQVEGVLGSGDYSFAGYSMELE